MVIRNDAMIETEQSLIICQPLNLMSPLSNTYPSSSLRLYSEVTKRIPTQVKQTDEANSRARKTKSRLSHLWTPISEGFASGPLSSCNKVIINSMPKLSRSFGHWKLVLSSSINLVNFLSLSRSTDACSVAAGVYSVS